MPNSLSGFAFHSGDASRTVDNADVKLTISFLLIVFGATVAAFGMGMENAALIFLGLFLALVGVVAFLLLKVLSSFWQKQRHHPDE